MTQLTKQLNLVKGENLNLTKNNDSLKRVAFAMSWETTTVRIDNKEVTADPDASALLLGADGRLVSISGVIPVIFYNNLSALGIVHSGDDKGDKLPKGAATTDRETILVDFEKVDPRVESILFVATMHDEDAAQGKIGWDQSKLNFGLVNNLTIRAYDADTGDSLLMFELQEDASRYNTMLFGKLYRHKGEWKFSAMGEPKSGNLNTLQTAYQV